MNSANWMSIEKQKNWKCSELGFLIISRFFVSRLMACHFQDTLFLKHQSFAEKPFEEILLKIYVKTYQ